MNPALAVTAYTLREMTRRKLLWVFAGGGLLLVAALGGFIALAPGELLQGQTRSLFLLLFAGQAAEFFLFLTAFGIGSTAVYNDLDSGSIVSLFSKPISRLQYTLGKVVAAVASQLAVSLLLGAGLLVLLEIAGGGHEDLLLKDVGRITANEVTVMLMVLALTAVTNNIVAIVIGFVVTQVANIVNTFWLLVKDATIPVGWKVALGVLHWILPRQLRFSVLGELVRVRGGAVNLNAAGLINSDWTDIAYWAAYVVLLILLLYLLVRRKQV